MGVDQLETRAAGLMQRLADIECPGLDELERTQWETGRLKAIQELALARGLTHAGQVRAETMLAECDAWVGELVGEEHGRGR